MTVGPRRKKLLYLRDYLLFTVATVLCGLAPDLGVASSSAMLSWRPHAAAHGGAVLFAARALLGAVKSSSATVAAFAVIAAILSLVRDLHPA